MSESAGVTLAKAGGFLVCGALAQWGASFLKPSNQGADTAYWNIVRSGSSLASAVVLTWLFQRCLDGRRWADSGVSRKTASGLWYGIFAGLMPALALCLTLLFARKVELRITRDAFWFITPAILWSVSSALLFGGYGFQKLASRFGAVVAASIVCVVMGVEPFVIAATTPFAPILWAVWQVASGLLATVVVHVTGSVWAAAGAAIGLALSPVSGIPVSMVSMDGFGQAGRFWDWSASPACAALGGALLVVWLWRSLRPRPALRIGYGLPAVWIGSAAAVLSLVLEALVAGPDLDGLDGRIVLALFLGLFMTPAFLTLIYQAWAAIRDPSTRTSPGAAVGLLFIPLYNLYWVFQILPGFATDYNIYLDRHEIDAPRLSIAPFACYVLLSLLAFAPPIRLIAGPLALALGIYVVWQITSAVNLLPDVGDRPRKVAGSLLTAD